MGANISMYSWEVFKNSPKRKISAFEPDPLNFELLEKTLKEYDIGNIEIYPFALSNKNQKVSFFQDTISTIKRRASLLYDKEWCSVHAGCYYTKLSFVVLIIAAATL